MFISLCCHCFKYMLVTYVEFVYLKTCDSKLKKIEATDNLNYTEFNKLYVSQSHEHLLLNSIFLSTPF